MKLEFKQDFRMLVSRVKVQTVTETLNCSNTHSSDRVLEVYSNIYKEETHTLMRKQMSYLVILFFLKVSFLWQISEHMKNMENMVSTIY